MKLRDLVVASVVVFVFVGAAYAQDSSMTGQKPSAPLTFRVTGQAEAMPETVTLHFSVVGDGETLSSAMERLDKTERAVADALRKFDVKPEQMKVDRFSLAPLQPTVDPSMNPMNPTPPPSLGYRASRDYSITPAMSVKSLPKAIQIVDAALQAGARATSTPASSSSEPWRYGGASQPGMLLEYAVSDPDKLLKEAVNDALARARKLAEEVIKQTGKESLQLVSVQMTQSTAGYPYSYPGSGMDDSPSTTAANQSVKVTVSAEVGFSYK